MESWNGLEQVRFEFSKLDGEIAFNYAAFPALVLLGLLEDETPELKSALLSAFTPSAVQSMEGARWDVLSQQVVTELDQEFLSPGSMADAELLFGFMPATVKPVDTTKAPSRVANQASKGSVKKKQQDTTEAMTRTTAEPSASTTIIEFDLEALDTAKQKQGKMDAIRTDQSAVSSIKDDESFGYGELGVSTEVSFMDTDTLTQALMSQSISDMMSQMSDIQEFKETTQRQLDMQSQKMDKQDQKMDKQSQCLESMLLMMTNISNQSTIPDRGKHTDQAGAVREDGAGG